MKGRQLSEFEDRRAARLAEALEAAEDALYAPSPIEAKIPLHDRNKAVERARDALVAYLNNIVRA
jgi:hypothetical protein